MDGSSPGMWMGIVLLALTSGCGEDAEFPSGQGGAAQSSTSAGAAGSGGTAGSGGAAQGGAGGNAQGGAGGNAIGGQGGFDPAQDPSVTIYHPGDMECRVVNMPIPCSGIASDPQDGMLTGNALTWTSSLEGQLGTGSPIDWTPTTVGSHVLELSATDSDGNTGAAQITIDVQAQCQ